MGVKIQSEQCIRHKKRKKKCKRKRRKKVKKKQSFIEKIQEQYKKRKWLVRSVFMTKCTISAILLILEFV